MTSEPQTFPITQQFRDVVEKARAGHQQETAEQRETLQLVQRDTLTSEELNRVAAAFSLSSAVLLDLTNTVREVGNQGGPG